MKRVINFSGGKTSALMTILLKPTEDDIVLFTDTKWEHPLTYKFIDDFENNENIKVHRTTYTNAKANGSVGFEALVNTRKSMPNRMKRICTVDLKVLTAKRYLRSLGVQTFENYIGFRVDEPQRVVRFSEQFKKVFTKFPLYDRGITKEMVNQFWLTKSYNLEIPSILGNCDLCFLKGKDNLIKIMALYPELAEKWIKAEEGKKGTFIQGVSYKELLKIAKSQFTLFELDKALPAYSCSCTT